MHPDGCLGLSMLAGLMLMASTTAWAQQADRGAFVGVGGADNLVLSLRPPAGGTVEIDGVMFATLIERLNALETAIKSANALYCPPGSTDSDRSPSTPCTPCGPGTHAPEGSFGSCDKFMCTAGTTDHDSNSSTPCVSCGPGHYIPTPGATGACTAHTCPSGHADVDGDPTTPCLAAVFQVTDAGNAAAVGYYKLYATIPATPSNNYIYAKMDVAGRWAAPMTFLYFYAPPTARWMLVSDTGAAAVSLGPTATWSSLLYFHRSADGSKIPTTGWETGTYSQRYYGELPAPSISLVV